MIKTERLCIRSLIPENWKSLQAIAANFAQSPYVIYDRPLLTEDGSIQELTKQFADTGFGLLCCSQIQREWSVMFVSMRTRDATIWVIVSTAHIREMAMRLKAVLL